MADDLKLIIGVDDRDLIRSQKEQKKFQANLILIEQAFRKGTITAGRYQSELNKQAKALSNLGGTYRKANSEVRSYAASLRKASAEQLEMSAATVMGGKKMNRFGMISQQVGYQVGDFFVQVQSGTSALVALGQQGTQLAGLLPGLTGAVVGISLAVGTMLARSFMQARDATESSSDSLRAFQKVLKDNQTEVDKTVEKIKALEAGFESVAEAKIREGLKGTRDRIKAIEDEISALENMHPIINAISGAQDGLLTILRNKLSLELEALETGKEQLSVILKQNNEFKTQQTILSDIMSNRDKQRLTSNALLKDLEQQSTLLFVERTAGKDSLAYSEQKRAVEKENFDLMIMSLGLSGEQLDELQAQYEVLEKEKILLKDLTDEEKARLDVILLRQKMVGVGLASGRGGDPRQQGTRYQQEFGYKTIDELIAEFESKNKINKSTKKAIDLTRELTDVQKQQVAIADSVSGAFDNFFMQLVDGTTSAKDAFRSMAADIIQQLYRILVVEQLVQSIAGAITSGFAPASAAGTEGTVAPPRRPTGVFDRMLGRYDGGGYTGSGPRSGGLDGKGGFMAMLHPRETVVDHTKGQSSGGTVVNQVFNISANTSDDTKRLITQTIAQASPAIINQSVGAVMNQRRRGGAMKSAFG
ncbi:hypothetical protein OAF54_00515 [bacterium]|nr:hypothetical protein [bacterium]